MKAEETTWEGSPGCLQDSAKDTWLKVFATRNATSLVMRSLANMWDKIKIWANQMYPPVCCTY